MAPSAGSSTRVRSPRQCPPAVGTRPSFYQRKQYVRGRISSQGAMSLRMMRCVRKNGLDAAASLSDNHAERAAATGRRLQLLRWQPSRG